MVTIVKCVNMVDFPKFGHVASYGYDTNEVMAAVSWTLCANALNKMYIRRGFNFNHVVV